MAASPAKKPRLHGAPLPNFLSPAVPHSRADCPELAFFPSVHDTSHRRNLKHCVACFCWVCDTPADACPAWAAHCMAFFSHPDWQVLRVRARDAKPGNPAKVPSRLVPPCVLRDPKLSALLDTGAADTGCATFGRARVCAPVPVVDLDAVGAAVEPSTSPAVRPKPEPLPVAASGSACGVKTPGPDRGTSGSRSDALKPGEESQNVSGSVTKTDGAAIAVPSQPVPAREEQEKTGGDLNCTQDLRVGGASPALSTAGVQFQNCSGLGPSVPGSSMAVHAVSSRQPSVSTGFGFFSFPPVAQAIKAENNTAVMKQENTLVTNGGSNGLQTKQYSRTVQRDPVLGAHRARQSTICFSRKPSTESSKDELGYLHEHWSVEEMLPAPHIERKRMQPAQSTTGKHPVSKRILIGFVDLWRPYCSHMSAKTIKQSVGRGDKDIVSVSTASDVRVPGLKNSHVQVLVQEMGFDLEKHWALDPQDAGRYAGAGVAKELVETESLFHKSAYAREDGSGLSKDVLEALKDCMNRHQVEVQWELTHHAGADNPNKAFATFHDLVDRWDTETKKKVFHDQLAWLKKCDSRMKDTTRLDLSNCCLLRAWIYLTPEVLRSNMVSAASFCDLSSPSAHLIPIDGGSSLATTLLTKMKMEKYDRYIGSSLRYPSLSLSISASKLQQEGQKWSNLELSSREHTRESMMVVMAALKPLEDCYVNTSQSRPGKAPASILAAKLSDGSSTFESLCLTHRLDMDMKSLENAQKMSDELRFISNEAETDSMNKASNAGILASQTFTVSDGYANVSPQPPEILLPLRRYQLESLAWMLDQEKKRSISDPFWIRLHGLDRNGNLTEVHYCPLTGSVSRFPPPPVVGGVLAEEMGLGKTIIAVSLITRTIQQARETYHMNLGGRNDLIASPGTLIVCPVSLLKQWEREVSTNVSIPLKVVTWYGASRTTSARELASCDVVLTTYGIVSQGKVDLLHEIKWYRVILDETNYIKGGGYACSGILHDLVASRRWAVSGTPFGDSFRQSFRPTMRFLGVTPFAEGSSFDTLSKVFATPLGDADLANSHLLPRFAYVLKNIMMRHTKSQKLYGQPLIELPPASGRYVGVALDDDELREYQSLEREIKRRASRFLRSQKSFGSNVVSLRAMMLRLRTKADGVDPSDASKSKGTAGKTHPAKVEKVEVLRLEVRRPIKTGSKVKRLLQDVQTYRARDPSTKFVVFTEFKKVQAEIRRAMRDNGLEALTIEGSMDGIRRGRVIRRFAEDMDVACLVLSMAAGACGLTLTMANIVVLFEVGLNMSTELQAVNRIHRIGQTRPVETLTYVAEGTIDEKMTTVRKRRGQPRVVGEAVASGQTEELSTLEVYRQIFDYSETD